MARQPFPTSQEKMGMSLSCLLNCTFKFIRYSFARHTQAEVESENVCNLPTQIHQQNFVLCNEKINKKCAEQK